MKNKIKQNIEEEKKQQAKNSQKKEAKNSQKKGSTPIILAEETEV